MQDAEASEYVDDSQDNHSVPNAVVIRVPYIPVLVSLHWPQEQCENLQNFSHQQP